MIVGFDHVQLAMPEELEAEARAFYGDLLGLREMEKPEPLRARGGVWFKGPGVDVHLGVEASFMPAKKAHPAFRVTDLETLYTRLEQAKHKPTWDIALPEVRRFYVHDPFGNRLEFMEAQHQNANSDTLE